MRRSGLRVGVIHTVGSVCRCAEAISQGLRALGHLPVLVDSALVEAQAKELAEHCELVFDHTDTFEGRGLLRATVRMILEGRGARLVGSPGRVCFLADDKAAAKAVMARAGIPTLPSVVLSPGNRVVPQWLRPPWVLKSTSEHMSRGICIAKTQTELEEKLEAVAEKGRYCAWMVESHVPGIELAVPVLEIKGSPLVLPVVEMQEACGEKILDENFKRLEFRDHRKDLLLANLDPSLDRELRLMACKAFEVLGLRDYARFDVRVSEDGTPFFLEANVTPSLEPFEAMAFSARLAGMEYPELISRMLESALERYGEGGLKTHDSLDVQLPVGNLKILIPRGVHAPAQSTLEMARIMDVRPGEEVLELGCGCGVLSIVAAKMGAKRVVAMDLDPASLEATLINARLNRVEQTVEVRAGSWFQVLDPVAEKQGFHVILATPPQTPSPRPMGPKYGGPEGLWHIKRILRSAPRFLKPAEGRLWLLAISLVNQQELFRLLEEFFQKVEVASISMRTFGPEEYEALQPGLFGYIQDLAQEGKAWVGQSESGNLAFRNLCIRASFPREVP
ncbi:MAG: 50S ribosomal protein L11 methyltransferase [bacterium]